MPIRRTVLLVVVGLLLAGLAITVWQGYQLQRELTRAESSVRDLRSALNARDPAARDRAISELQTAASAAKDRTDGISWRVLGMTPFFGDDAEGLQVLARTLSLVSTDGVAPLAESLDALDRVSANGRIDLNVVETLQVPVGRASQVFSSAAREVNGVDSSGFLGVFDTRFEDYAQQLDTAASALRSAGKAAEVLPDMVGGDRDRDYLLLFQNNAEIRATGGMPGSWARVRAEEGRIEMIEQGTASDFRRADEPVVPLTASELAIYGKEYGLYFQDPGFAPDFPRGAEMWEAHWERKFPRVELDGILALDPVGMSYLLEGTGPVYVEGRRLASDNVVDELLSRPYLDLDPAGQDVLFEKAARAVFEAATGTLDSPVDFLEGLSRASREGRFLVAPFDEEDASRLSGSRVLGALPGEDGSTPHVDIGVNDATGSKMSYYLRYRAVVDAQSCNDDRQQLTGRLTVSQTISPAQAERLPESVTGKGDSTIEQGTQAVLFRIYGPYGGAISDIMIDGTRVVAPNGDVMIEGRPVVTVVTQVSTRDDIVITWQMESGSNQLADGELGITPGILPGGEDLPFASAC